jgi:predicted metalloprotease
VALRTRLVTALLAFGLLAACASAQDPVTAASPTVGVAPSSGDQSTSLATALTGNDLMLAAVKDVTTYWTTEFPKLYPGETYQPIDPLNVFPSGPDDPPPACGQQGKAPYQAVARNAFYCPQEDFIAWDAVALVPLLLQDFGPLTLGVVVAHELGHRVQHEHGILDGRFITFVTEQQADCFAGAWVRHVRDDHVYQFRAEPADLDGATAGFVRIRDPVGANPVTDPAAHGSAFQRVNAFRDGFTEGTQKCKSYEDSALQPELVPETFNDSSDLSTNGNLPFERTEPVVEANLDAFWTRALRGRGPTWTKPTINAFDPSTGASCGTKHLKGVAAIDLHFYCEIDDTLNWDESHLMPTVHDQIGDMAEAMIIATQYGQRAQHVLGLPGETRAASLQADCFSGGWAGAMKSGELAQSIPVSDNITLAPGDMDEAVAGFLRFAKQRNDLDVGPIDVGSGFQRIEAIRNGFLAAFDGGVDHGIDACLNGAGGQ